jgi:hypothetical protein
MDIKVGEVVSVRHYSKTKLLDAIVTDVKFDLLYLKFTDKLNDFTYTSGDPVVLGFESNNLVYISSCNIMDVDQDESTMKLKTDSLETLTNKRLFERFPVSFNANITIGSSTTAHSCAVKNLSFNGMLACTKQDFPLYQELKFDFMIKYKISLKAIVIRKTKTEHNFEYGLKIVYTDPHTPSLIKKFLQTLKKEQEEYVNDLKQNAQ